MGDAAATKTDFKKWVGEWEPASGSKNNRAMGIAKDSVSKTSGGTAHLLDEERAKASFDVANLTHFLDDNDAKKTAKRRWLWAAAKEDNSVNYELSRSERLKRHIRTFYDIHLEFAEKAYQPTAEEVLLMSIVGKNQGGFGLHFGAFTTTVQSQGTMEQQMEWLLPAYTMRITGALAQTEMGHGSSVRSLQTTAEYDPDTEEFVLNSNSLLGIKFWPGNLGKTATHSLVYANLITKGEEKGFHVFMAQLRDENHKPLPGITLYEAGPKFGDEGTDTGVLQLDNVRIPRDWLLMKHQVVEKDGTYVKNPKTGDSKVQYSTMLTIRAGLVMAAGYRLMQGVTIAARYSCVRHQGLVNTQNTSGESERNAPENQIIEYQNQQWRLFKQLARGFAFSFTGKNISRRLASLMENITMNEDASELPEMHAVSSGLKALVTYETAEGLEECRKLLGGHGVLIASGVAQMVKDQTTYVTAEGDKIVLELQSARYLVKSFNEARQGKTLAGLSAYLQPCQDPGFDATKELACGEAQTSDDFKSLNLLNRLFRGRALNAVVDVAERFNALMQDKKIPFDTAWNQCAVDLGVASRNHCYYMILNNFVDALETCQDDKTRAVLTNVCRLYALQNIEEDFGAFDLSRSQRAAVRQAVREILPVIRADVIPLVDAFEFPDNGLISALGRHDGRVYEALFESVKQSSLNRQDPFEGFDEVLRPHLDQEFIKEHAQMQRVGPLKNSKKTSKL